MPYKSKIQKREYQKLLMRKKRVEFYKHKDELSVVRPLFQIKYKDGSDSLFTFTPIVLSEKDKLTLNKLILRKFI